MSSTLSMLQHLRNYTTGGLVSALAGVVSFPILTRTLEVDAYGALGLVTATLTLFVAFGKLGLQHSVVRFYEQVNNGNSEWNLQQFFSTLMLLIGAFSCIAMACWLFTALVVIPNLSDSKSLSGYFALATVFLFFSMFSSIVTNVLNAQQQSRHVMISTTVKRFSYLMLILLLLAADAINVYFVLACYMLAEAVSLVYLTRVYLPGKTHTLAAFDTKLAKSLIVFGLPLMVLETLALALRLTDRYLIQILMDDSALGQYAASYNLTMYVKIILITSLISSVKPRYNQLWEAHGREVTRRFLSEGVHLYYMIGIPIAAIFALTAPHLMNILASDQYAPGTVVIPWIISALMIEGANVFLAAGLYIKKNTKPLLQWGAVAMILNLVLNLIFIPRMGIMGASMATLFCFVVFSAGLLSSSFKVLSFEIFWIKPLLVACASLTVWFFVRQLDIGVDIYNLVVKGAVSTLLLVAFILVIDGKVREQVSSRLPAGLRLRRS